MRAFGGVLGKTPNTAHVIPVLCDSRGLQLVIKDLLQLPTIKKIFAGASPSLARGSWLDAKGF